MESRILRSVLLCILVSTTFARFAKYSSTQQQNDLLEAKAQSFTTKSAKLYPPQDDYEIDFWRFYTFYDPNNEFSNPIINELDISFEEQQECVSDWKIGDINQIYQAGLELTVTVNNNVENQDSSPTLKKGMSLKSAIEDLNSPTQDGEPKYAYKYITDLECLDFFSKFAFDSTNKLSSTQEELASEDLMMQELRARGPLPGHIIVIAPEKLTVDNSDFVPYEGDISRSRNSDSGEGETSPPQVPTSGTPKTKYPIGGTTKVPLTSY